MADSVSEIGKFAFSHCLFLKNVEFSNSLRIIENSAFCYCKKIEELKFPASLFSIKGLAFFGCAGLSKVSVSMKLNNIKVIPSAAVIIFLKFMFMNLMIPVSHLLKCAEVTS